MINFGKLTDKVNQECLAILKIIKNLLCLDVYSC